jgi:nicotinate-nucleotide pyrophosphorylase (carboxylating)
VLLDNMSTEELRAAVALAGGSVTLEASGNIRLDTVAAVAATGIDYISAGALTHSARRLDFGLDAA